MSLRDGRGVGWARAWWLSVCGPMKGTRWSSGLLRSLVGRQVDDGTAPRDRSDRKRL